MSQIKSLRDLIVYQKAYKLAMELFEITKGFPKEEKFSLTDQIRRSSRAVTSNIAESWAKKLYLKHFVSKLTDALGEEYEPKFGWIIRGIVNILIWQHIADSWVNMMKCGKCSSQ